MKSIAIVILNWNGKKLLEEFLPFVVNYSPEATIYVADNASGDDSVNFLQEYYPDVTIISNKKNYGYAGGYNKALKEVEEDIYVLLNSDVEVTEGWLSPIISLFEKDTQTAIIQPKILDYYRRDHFEYAGAAGGFIDKYGFPYCRGRIFNTIERDNGQYGNTEIFWASGACFFIRKEVFWKLGGFDDDFFAHQEEIDLCWRAFNSNYKVRFCADSVIYHVGGATLKNSSSHKTFLNFRNSLWMLLKNLPTNQLFPVLFIRLTLDGIAGWRFLAKGKFSHFFAIMKSHFYFYLKLFYFLNKRQSNQYKKYYKNRSIVARYFALNGKIFGK
ncbi:glycosyltransferase family 2 protein [Flavobacterium arcticum]|uniref:Glycosyltransferase family 2 protein n=1 Tax=Flavobacterium arcticum TaxID=1784713 RepID=A0A345HDD2_9FLAO|nr:glycosyltransferase family 2 protein [Flavobacterium arcticum]AXG74592.1 glycosyltransferase family 2 protein [Flavobacterium arcticum]KAF2512287.1 glycosyltransferase family 2 protein [Flavobacterium arcticum]